MANERPDRVPVGPFGMGRVSGMDDMEVLEAFDEETVKEMGRKCIEAAGPDSYVLGGTASGTYTDKAARNFIALVDVAKEYA